MKGGVFMWFEGIQDIVDPEECGSSERSSGDCKDKINQDLEN